MIADASGRILQLLVACPKKGAAYNATLPSEEKLETVALDQIQNQILSKEEKIHRNTGLYHQQAWHSHPSPTAQKLALKLTVTDVESTVHRWDDFYERGDYFTLCNLVEPKGIEPSTS
jgi:hypothetical protein